jgi:ferric-dicitrate binding protein FerR (iron transport regulator)
MPEYISYGSLLLNAGAVLCFLKFSEKISSARKSVDNATSMFQSLKEQRDQALEANARLLKEVEKERGLSTLHISKNEEFEAQSKKAWEMYRSAGLAASNAQAWLMRELERTVLLLNKYRSEKGEQPIQVNDKLKELVANFKREVGDTHGG